MIQLSSPWVLISVNKEERKRRRKGGAGPRMRTAALDEALGRDQGKWNAQSALHGQETNTKKKLLENEIMQQKCILDSKINRSL